MGSYESFILIPETFYGKKGNYYLLNINSDHFDYGVSNVLKSEATILSGNNAFKNQICVNLTKVKHFDSSGCSVLSLLSRLSKNKGIGSVILLDSLGYVTRQIYKTSIKDNFKYVSSLDEL